MARGLRGSVKRKREMENTQMAGRKKEDKKTVSEPVAPVTPSPSPSGSPDLPTVVQKIAQETQVIDQPAVGKTVEAEAHRSDKFAKEVVVGAPLDPVPDEDWTFEFALKPGVGHRTLVEVTRNDGEMTSKQFETKAEANAWIKQRQDELAAFRAKKLQEKSEKAAQVQPVVTLNATVIAPAKPLGEPEPIRNALAPTPSPITPQPPVAPQTPVALHSEKLSDSPLASRDCLTLHVRMQPKTPLHIIPELADKVKDFLGKEEVDNCHVDENGVIIVTHPSCKKARFFMVGIKPIMVRM